MSLLESMVSASVILYSSHALGRLDGLEPLPVRPYGVPPVLMRPCRSSAGREGLTSRAYGIGGPVPKTGTYPPNQAARNRHNGALLAPGRCDAVEHRLEGRVTG